MRTLLIVGALASALLAQEARAPRIYIEPQDLDSHLAAAIIKKHVPAVITEKKDEAQFVLAGTSKVRGFGGYGFSRATVRLIDNRTQEVVWADYVSKPRNLAQQSMAEAIAKHLKTFLEEHPK